MPAGRTLVASFVASITVVAGTGVVMANDNSINAGTMKASGNLPFDIQHVADFNTPWALAFLPDGKAIVTEKPGHMLIVDIKGNKQEITGVPEVLAQGQNGMLDIALAPDFEQSRRLYFTYTAPDNNNASRSRVTLTSAILDSDDSTPLLKEKKVLWQQSFSANGGQPGGRIAISPDKKYLFLSLGDRMLPDTALDPDRPSGKILRLNPDGSTPPDNPYADQGGVRAQTWSIGHRTPYGLSFSASGDLWETEMGPKGGDELNLVSPGNNYGWGDVSNGHNYDGSAIPDHATRPEFSAPKVFWTPVISPGGIAIYDGNDYPGWNESILISSLSGKGLVRVGINNDNSIGDIERWQLDKRIRDVAIAPDGAIWLIEDANPGQLMRLTPKRNE